MKVNFSDIVKCFLVCIGSALLGYIAVLLYLMNTIRVLS
jgi:hypothetical protein